MCFENCFTGTLRVIMSRTCSIYINQDGPFSWTLDKGHTVHNYSQKLLKIIYSIYEKRDGKKIRVLQNFWTVEARLLKSLMYIEMLVTFPQYIIRRANVLMLNNLSQVNLDYIPTDIKKVINQSNS